MTLSFALPRRAIPPLMLLLCLSGWLVAVYQHFRPPLLSSLSLQNPLYLLSLAANSSYLSWATPTSTRDSITEYVQSMPSLRPWDARGVPEYDMLGEDKRCAFDWPSTKHMFLFGDSFSATYNSPYKDNGIGDGHPKKWSVSTVEKLPPGVEKWGSFDTQVEEFRELFTPMPGPAVADWHSDDSLFLAMFGINDLQQMDRHGIGRLNLRETCEKLIDAYMNNLRTLRSLGAKHFLILNLPPQHRAPKFLLPHGVGRDVEHRIREGVPLFNSLLSNALEDFRMETRLQSGGEVMLFDLNRLINMVLDNPEVFGLTDTVRFEVNIGNETVEPGRMGFAWLDNQHPSWTVSSLIARGVHGFLMRHSRSLRYGNMTENGLVA
ncbi:hypothetical protein M231_02891 [Tremella mesenterica]|uniref:Uncharacterized protein n=1 Tax=Tremella mesenterica TaxID=5217 RepID=A0A4Q1BPK4_TREME|nr:hypothetical protein M231_02891 [Tremella mesenterica]